MNPHCLLNSGFVCIPHFRPCFVRDTFLWPLKERGAFTALAMFGVMHLFVGCDIAFFRITIVIITLIIAL